MSKRKPTKVADNNKPRKCNASGQSSETIWSCLVEDQEVKEIDVSEQLQSPVLVELRALIESWRFACTNKKVHSYRLFEIGDNWKQHNADTNLLAFHGSKHIDSIIRDGYDIGRSQFALDRKGLNMHTAINTSHRYAGFELESKKIVRDDRTFYMLIFSLPAPDATARGKRQKRNADLWVENDSSAALRLSHRAGTRIVSRLPMQPTLLLTYKVVATLGKNMLETIANAPGGVLGKRKAMHLPGNSVGFHDRA